MNQETHISNLIYRHLIGTATPEDESILQQWLEESAGHRRFFDSMTDIDSLADEWNTARLVDSLRPAADMERRIASLKARRMKRALCIAAAAAILLAASGTIWYMRTPQTTLDEEPTASVAPVHKTIDDIKAGTIRASVTDRNGHTVELTALDSGLNMAKNIARRETVAAAPARELCLAVPRGGEFKIILEDSTEVWLNTESTLCYPEAFSGSERRVSVTGEAYFRVRKDPARPFYVESEGQRVKVYGTTFNIRAYADEEMTYTTLESGSISLSNADGSGEVFLSKGHQAILDHATENLTMTTVDPSAVASWHYGRFVFEDQPLERIMRDLSRWYDFKYEFADRSLASRVFMGSIPRYADFRYAIQILENCGGIRFTLTEDNTVLISEK